MPKAKSTQVITHRIELQETERATLEAALAGRFITNGVSAVGSVFAGIGSALAPFSSVLGVLAGVWVAGRSWEEIMGAAQAAGEQTKANLEESFHERGALLIERVSAWLAAKYGEGGWDAVCPSDQDGIVELAMELMAMKGTPGVSMLGEWATHPANPNRIPGAVPNPLGDVIAPDWFVDEIVTKFLNTVCNPDNVMARNSSPVELWSEWYSIEQYGKDAYYWTQKKYSPKWTEWAFGWA